MKARVSRDAEWQSNTRHETPKSKHAVDRMVYGNPERAANERTTACHRDAAASAGDKLEIEKREE